MSVELGIAGRLAQNFLNSKLTPLFIAASLAVGIFAVAIIPREEEPQILVPMLDIATAMPGASPAEVEERVTLPIENLVHEISGVEYVYSTSAPGQSLVIVRFLVGTPQEDALIKVYSKLYSNFDRMPPGVSQPLIKARSIDDVPILALTLWGEHYNGYQLRAIANEMQHNIAQTADVSETAIIGGLPRAMRVVLSTEKLNAYGLSPRTIAKCAWTRAISSIAAKTLKPLWWAWCAGIPCICATWPRRSWMGPRSRLTMWSTARRTQPHRPRASIRRLPSRWPSARERMRPISQTP